MVSLWLRQIWAFRLTLVLVLTPLLLLPLPLVLPGKVSEVCVTNKQTVFWRLHKLAADAENMFP